MKKGLIFITSLALLGVSGICLAGEVPHQVGVFVLNRDIADFRDFVIMETALPIRYMENIEEVEIKPIKGIKSGYIAYATCAAPGHIVSFLKISSNGLKRNTVNRTNTAVTFFTFSLPGNGLLSIKTAIRSA
jgi:hypothetical protein